MADVDPRQVLRTGYDRIANRYARWIADSPTDLTAVRYLRQLAERLPRGARVLDLGCGGCDRWSGLIAVHPFALTGVDISSEQLRRARANVPGALLVEADIARLELASSSGFDTVASLYAFNHLPAHRQVGAQRRYVRG
jgi:SAM-dependent methyltransferase